MFGATAAKCFSGAPKCLSKAKLKIGRGNKGKKRLRVIEGRRKNAQTVNPVLQRNFRLSYLNSCSLYLQSQTPLFNLLVHIQLCLHFYSFCSSFPFNLSNSPPTPPPLSLPSLLSGCGVVGLGRGPARLNGSLH